MTSLSTLEDKMLNRLKDINKSIGLVFSKTDLLHRELSECQKAIQLSLQRSVNGHRANDLEEVLSNVMKLKNDIEKLNDQDLEPLYYFAEKADNLRKLKEHINKDEFLKSEWEKLLFYMRMNDGK